MDEIFLHSIFDFASHRHASPLTVFSASMLRFWPLFAVINVVAALFDDYDNVTQLLNCNWAQEFDDFDRLLNDAQMQDDLMLLASHWEGRFAAGGGVNFASGMTQEWTINYESGDLVRMTSIF
jgi:hypothetical protein